MTTKTRPELVTTTAGKIRPAGPYELRNVQERDLGGITIAWTASLYEGTKRIAAVQQDGNGGATTINYTDQAKATPFEQWCAHWAEHDPEYDSGGDVPTEPVINALWVEATATKVYTSIVRKGKTPIRDERGKEYTVSTQTLLTPGAINQIKNQIGSAIQIWKAGFWVTP